ncbi:hypothetical protein BB561_003653 [Smittium simulii]|uniref:Zinc finger PHD-type domain-containing protein n=1 Tax=Smittium simulii TaxID=133385 RepID=A0A2T9YK83_9FUNG|nr:hypothetical protein BB561_003653 [Smittium simulii]
MDSHNSDIISTKNPLTLNIQNVAHINSPRILPSTNAIVISQLFTKLKHLEGVFDLFLNPDKSLLAQNELLAKHNSFLDTEFKSFLYENSLISPNNNIPSFTGFNSPIKKNIIKDVFFTLPQSSHEVNISNLVAQQNSEALTPTFNKTTFSDHILQLENISSEENIPNYDQAVLVSDFSKKNSSYHKALESGFGDMFITDSFRHYDNDDETTSQSTACDDSDWDEYDSLSLEHFPVFCTKIKKKPSPNLSLSTPTSFSDSINDPKDQDLTLANLGSSNCDHTEHVAGDVTPRTYDPLVSNISSFLIAQKINKFTIFQEFTKNGVDWCRYCGTTEGINWRPGPWGRRTLCNKHGCDYKGYGFASKTPRLDLRSFIGESIDDRKMPILQSYCYVCLSNKDEPNNPLYYCSGCPNSYHKNCLASLKYTDTIYEPHFFCRYTCLESSKKNRIVIELQKRKLPFMCSQTALYKSESIKNSNSDVDHKNPDSKKRCTNIEYIDKIKKRKSSRS